MNNLGFGTEVLGARDESNYNEQSLRRTRAMSYRPRIFISHSAKEPEAKSLCRAVADELIHAEFDVLWDQNLQTSQAWRSVVDEWIWRCDGAVLVLSQAATESRYVAYEAALLRQRWKKCCRQFLLIPMCPRCDSRYPHRPHGSPAVERDSNQYQA